MKLTVEMYGLSPYTNLNKIDIDLEAESGIPQFISAIGQKIPTFEGHVKEAGINRLVETYGLYINGQFVQQDDPIKLKSGDRVVIILLAVGG
jgi:hypothetical protein